MNPTHGEEFSARFTGDIGIGTYYTGNIIKGKTDPVSTLPYGSFDYGKMFMRTDTLGIKTVKMGYGYLEFVGRIRMDGFNADVTELQGLSDRKTSFPLGLGTLQVTPVGAFYLNAFHDINKSGGNLFEAIYFAKLDVMQAALYPLAGIEYQSRKFVRYYYGISDLEAKKSSYSVYQSNGSFNPLFGLIVDVPLTGSYHLNLYLRHQWLGNAIRSSPIVKQTAMDSGYVTVSYRFE